eukprot:scaffold2045_cov404-Prasinococcus_capsulatus_cf.AAC.9
MGYICFAVLGPIQACHSLQRFDASAPVSGPGHQQEVAPRDEMGDHASGLEGYPTQSALKAACTLDALAFLRLLKGGHSVLRLLLPALVMHSLRLASLLLEVRWAKRESTD